MSAEPVFLHPAPAVPRPNPSPIAAALQALDDGPDTRCIVGRWLDTLEPSERDELAAACQPGAINTVHKALSKAGIGIPSETSWRRHWTGHCDCPAS